MEFSWFGDELFFIVPESQIGFGDFENHLFGLSGFKRYLPEVFQFFYRTCNRSHHIADIELYGFRTGIFAGILHRHPCRQFSVRIQAVAVERNIGIFERGI